MGRIAELPDASLVTGPVLCYTATVNRKKKLSKESGTAECSAADNVFQLKITLRDVAPPIWRRVLVPSNFTLGSLHGIIQAVMGWRGHHLHEFRLPPRGFGPPKRTFGHEGEDEDAVLLRDVLVRKGQMLLYEYDFGDGWLHGIQLEKILPLEPDGKYPLCVAGARACPPEDCGGSPGYSRLMKAIEAPSAKGNAELLAWSGKWDPESFSLDAANRRLGV